MKKILSLLLTVVMLTMLAGSVMAEPIPLYGTGSSPDDPLFDPSLGLTMTFYASNSYGEDSMPDFEEVKEWIEARTGLTLNFIYTSTDDFPQKMNTAFLGDKFDGFYYEPLRNVGRTLPSLYEDGLIVDINPYLETYGKNLQKYMGKGWDYVKNNEGAILAVTKRISNHRGLTPVIRADWVKQAGLDHLPTTMDELEMVFEYIKNNDVNGNGDPNDEIPFIAVGLTNLFSHFMGTFLGADGVDNTGINADYLAEDGTVRNVSNHPNFLAFLTKMREWYQKGYLYPEFMTVTTSQVEDIISSDRLGMYSAWYSGQVRPFRLVEEANPSKHYELLPNIESPIEGVVSSYSEGNEYTGVVCVSTSSEHPEVVVAYFDWMISDPDINCTVWNGIQGKHWEWVDEENFVFRSIGNAQRMYYKCFNGMCQFDAEDQFLYAYPDEYVAIKYDHYLQDMYSDSRVYNVDFDLKVPYNTLNTDLEFVSNDGPTLLEENVASYIMGTIDKADMERAIQQYNEIYGDIFSKVYTEQYNDWLAKQ